MNGAPSWLRLALGSVILWVGTIFCIVGVPFFLLGAQEALGEFDFARNAQSVRATVVDKSIDYAEPGRNNKTRYLVHYRFAAPDGASIERTEAVPTEKWETAAVGGVLDVRFVKGDPSHSRTADTTDWPFALIFMSLGLIFCAVGGPLAYFGGRETTRQWRLWRTGVPVTATVTAITGSSTTINGVRQLQIRYRYKDASEAEHEATSAPMSPERALEWSKGRQGHARYDQQNADSSVWTGKA